MSKYKLHITLAFIVIFGCFMSYFCLANPDNLQEVISNQVEIESLKNVVDVESPTNPHNTEAYSATFKPIISQKTPNINECLTFYIGEITDFYEIIITLLLGVIGTLLVVGFMYIHFTSKKQAEELAHEAVQSKSFDIILTDIVNKKITDFKNSDELMEIYSKLPDFAERLKAVEKEIDEESYDVIKDESGEE